MNPRVRSDVIIIAAGLLGLAAGQIALERVAGGGDTDTPSTVSAAQLATSVAVSRRIADAAHFGQLAVGTRAALAFAVGAGSTLVVPILRKQLSGRSRLAGAARGAPRQLA